MKPVVYKAVFDRDVCISSVKTGYCMYFKKGVPQQIPHRFREEVIEHGGKVSGDEEMIAKQKAEIAEKAQLEADLSAEKAKVAASERELAELKAEKAEKEEAKAAKIKEEEKLKEAAKHKLKMQKAEKAAAKELEEEK